MSTKRDGETGAEYRDRLAHEADAPELQQEPAQGRRASVEDAPTPRKAQAKPKAKAAKPVARKAARKKR